MDKANKDNSSLVGKRMKYCRELRKETLEDIAAIVGVHKTTIMRWEAGATAKIPLPIIETLARHYNVNPAWLSGKDVSIKETYDLPDGAFPYNPIMHRIPILGTISAGMPLYAEQNIEGYTYTDLNSNGEYFALRVRGDSMNAARIYEGDILVIRKQDVVEDGDIAVVLVDDMEATVKRFYHNNGTVTLMPQSTNPIHTPQIYDTKKVRIKIVGRVMQNSIQY